MYNGYRFIDSDAHILEPPDLWERYLEPQFRNELPRSSVDYQEEPLGFGIQVVVGDYTMPFSKEFSESRILLPGLGDAYADYARRGFPPQMYKQAMEQIGMDYMVVYPTVGLYATAGCRRRMSWRSSSLASPSGYKTRLSCWRPIIR